MTKQEQKRIEQARLKILAVRNFLTQERNNAHGNDEKQKEYNTSIDLLLDAIALITKK